MSHISSVKAFTNGEIGYISWILKAAIPGCLGFEIKRIYPDSPQDNTILPAWVAFKGQANKAWLPQDTSVWPVQKLSWKDLTLRKKRDKLVRRVGNTRIQYHVRPIVAYNSNLEEVKTNLKKTYTGKTVRLSYFDDGEKSDIVKITLDHGAIRTTFTNGILATQWLAHAMKNPSFKDIKKEIRRQKGPIREYLSGDVLETLKALILKASSQPNATLKMALYELEDEELINDIIGAGKKVDIILSNTSKNTQGVWDIGNKPVRKTFKNKKITSQDRMFNNNSIGHNKFVIYLENNKPLMVMTGSTNWTSNGLCAQSNNASIIDSPEVAQLYDEYFEMLRLDTKNFVAPQKQGSPTKNVQGKLLRDANAKGNKAITLSDGTKVTVWFSPNTPQVSVNKQQTPPDLSHVYSIMRKAQHAILFAVFLPGRGNAFQGDGIMSNIITESISLAMKDTSLMLYGAISDPTAMPNYVNPVKGKKNPPTPYTFDQGKIHVVRAASLGKKDIIGDFEAELLKTPGAHAIVHDKIAVVDPFSKDGAVIFGSHNQGFKASYANDENLVIIQNNPGLVRAFALHVLDIFEHYRFRAVQAELKKEHKKTWDGFLSLDDAWLHKTLQSGGKGDLAEYMAGAK